MQKKEQMARSLVGGVAASLKNYVSTPFVSRRGYTAAAAAAVTVGIKAEQNAAVGKGVTDGGVSYASASSSSWMPDPVTGDYRPVNRRKEAAELREALLADQQ